MPGRDKLRLAGPVPSKLLRMLAFAECLEQLGCSETESSRLIEDWLEREEGVVVERISGPTRTTAAPLAAAA